MSAHSQDLCQDLGTGFRTCLKILPKEMGMGDMSNFIQVCFFLNLLLFRFGRHRGRSLSSVFGSLLLRVKTVWFY